MDWGHSVTKIPKRPRDPNQLAKFIVDLATGSPAPQAAEKGRSKKSTPSSGTKTVKHPASAKKE
jgi:hypothetical protein